MTGIVEADESTGLLAVWSFIAILNVITAKYE